MLQTLLLTKAVQFAIERGFEAYVGAPLQQKTCDLFARIVPKGFPSPLYTLIWTLLPYTTIFSYFEHNHGFPNLGKTVQNGFRIPSTHPNINRAVCGFVYLVALGIFEAIVDQIRDKLQQFDQWYQLHCYDLEQLFPPQFPPRHRKTDIVFHLMGGDFGTNLQNLWYLSLRLRHIRAYPHLGNSRPYRQWKQTFIRFPEFQQFLQDQLSILLCPITQDLILLPVKECNGDPTTYERWPRRLQLIKKFLKGEYEYIATLSYVDNSSREDREYYRKVITAIQNLTTSRWDAEFREGVIAYLEELVLVNSHTNINFPQDLTFPQDLKDLNKLIQDLRKEATHDNPGDLKELPKAQ